MASNAKLTTKSSAKVQAVQEGMRRPVQITCIHVGLWLVMKSSETPQHADQSSQLGSKTTPVSTMPNEELGVATSQSHLHWQLCANQPAVAGLCQQQHQGRARSRHQPQPPALAGLCNTPAVAGLCQKQHQGRARSRHPPKSPAVAGLCKQQPQCRARSRHQSDLQLQQGLGTVLVQMDFEFFLHFNAQDGVPAQIEHLGRLDHPGPRIARRRSCQQRSKPRPARTPKPTNK